MKTCQEIEVAINEVKKRFKKKKPIAKTNCKTTNPGTRCKECNCWKITREYCS
jgi:hypothetical protein